MKADEDHLIQSTLYLFIHPIYPQHPSPLHALHSSGCRLPPWRCFAARFYVNGLCHVRLLHRRVVPPARSAHKHRENAPILTPPPSRGSRFLIRSCPRSVSDVNEASLSSRVWQGCDSVSKPTKIYSFHTCPWLGEGVLLVRTEQCAFLWR